MYQTLLHPLPASTDGSVLTEAILRQRADWFEALLRDYFKIVASADGYGLTLSAASGSASLEISVEGLHITVKHCQAITPNMTLVGISPNYSELPALQIEAETKPGIYNLLLIATPFQRRPWGSPDPALTPYRQPFELPAVRLELQAKGAMAHGPDVLKIGEVHLSDSGHARLDEAYLPPCVQVAAHEGLRARCRQIQSKWLRAAEDCDSILGRTRQRAYEKNQDAYLVMEWVQAMHNYLLQNKHYFNSEMEKQHPAQALSRCVILADHVRSGFKTSTDKQRLLHYIYGRMDNSSAPELWGDQLIGIFEEGSSATYVHSDLAGMLDTAMRIMDPLCTILNALAYDQHYNGHDAIIHTRKKSLFSI